MRRTLTILTYAALGIGAMLAQTGIAVPELASVDRDIPPLMAAAHVPGGAVAIVKDGRLVFARGYGLADVAKGEAFQPDALCRVGSVSKTITAATILRLVESGRLKLDDKVFADILTQFQPPPGKTPDPRLWTITVRQLLHHTGGHGRDTGADPQNAGTAATAAEVLHQPKPASYETLLRYAMGLPLDFDPGTRYSYSNYGFMVLARVVERVAGRNYEDVLRQEVLAPMGIRGMALGYTRPEDRLPGEVRYYDVPRAPLALSMYPDVRRLVPRPYAQFQLEASDGSGRWIASAIDLARFVARVEGTRDPAFFSPEMLKLLFERPNPFVSQDPEGRSWYAMGTGVFPSGAGLGWSHTGGYPGNTAGYLSFGDGYLFAFVFNATPDNDTFINAVYDVLVRLGQTQTNWPSHDLFPQFYSED
jgi:CubicO group peptidase (beta-lactamase class C family)